MRVAALTKSPSCALKAAGKTNVTDSTGPDGKPGARTTLTVKEEVEILIAVEVQAGILATGAVVSRWESSLAKKKPNNNNKINLRLDSFPLSHNPGLTPITSYFEQVDHARSDVFDGHVFDDGFL